MKFQEDQARAYGHTHPSTHTHLDTHTHTHTFMERGFFSLMCERYSPVPKYVRISLVCARHCSTEFMKHVLPRLSRPVVPGITCCGCACVRMSNCARGSMKRAWMCERVSEQACVESVCGGTSGSRWCARGTAAPSSKNTCCPGCPVPSFRRSRAVCVHVRACTREHM